MQIVICCLTAMSAHLLMSFCQTLFHRHLGHRRLGGKLFRNHVCFHHMYYPPQKLTSEHYLAEEGNNTPYFLVPVAVVVVAAYFIMPFTLLIVQVAAMSASFFAHVYLDKHYHVAGSWLERFSWFRKKQQLHFVHHRHANKNFAVIDYFWDRLLGTFMAADEEVGANPARAGRRPPTAGSLAPRSSGRQPPETEAQAAGGMIELATGGTPQI
jgi:sterol desaturase/sphingolipid hydroxylase (fatty acid hydroxylase superfamily)